MNEEEFEPWKLLSVEMREIASLTRQMVKSFRSDLGVGGNWKHYSIRIPRLTPLDLLWITNNDIDGTICTAEQIRCFQDSFAFLGIDGIIRRYGRDIGCLFDIIIGVEQDFLIRR